MTDVSSLSEAYQNGYYAAIWFTLSESENPYDLSSQYFSNLQWQEGHKAGTLERTEDQV